MGKSFRNKNIMFTIIAFFISIIIDYVYIKLFFYPWFGIVEIYKWNLITTFPVMFLVYLFFYIKNKRDSSFDLKTKKSKVTYWLILLVTIALFSFYIKPNVIVAFHENVDKVFGAGPVSFYGDEKSSEE